MRFFFGRDSGCVLVEEIDAHMFYGFGHLLQLKALFPGKLSTILMAQFNPSVQRNAQVNVDGLDDKHGSEIPIVPPTN